VGEFTTWSKDLTVEVAGRDVINHAGAAATESVSHSAARLLGCGPRPGLRGIRECSMNCCPPRVTSPSNMPTTGSKLITAA
jgi:hypothetical protein